MYGQICFCFKLCHKYFYIGSSINETLTCYVPCHILTANQTHTATALTYFRYPRCASNSSKCVKKTRAQVYNKPDRHLYAFAGISSTFALHRHRGAAFSTGGTSGQRWHLGQSHTTTVCSECTTTNSTRTAAAAAATSRSTTAPKTLNPLYWAAA